MVRYAILGPVELCDDARSVVVRGPGQAALLALMLVNANTVLSSDRLIDVLSAGQAPGAALKRLQMAIVRLRRTLGRDGVRGEAVLRTVAGGYTLAVQPGELDAEVFQTRVEQGRRALEAGDAKRARDVLGEALGMWRGPALAQIAYQEFAQPEIRRLEELRLYALEARVDCELQLGMHAMVIGELEALVGAHPGRERLAAQLMLALYRCARQGDALDVYARTRAYLAGELGLEPGPALQTLQSEILAQAPTLHWAGDQPSVAAATDESAVEPVDADELRVAAGPIMLALPRSLHAPANSPFVGRDTELARLRERWAAVCDGARAAVVVGGEAGIGKSRLASEVARTVRAKGALVLYGRCDEGLAVPYQPFVEALRPYANAVGLDRIRTELGDLAPELGRLVPELAALGGPVRADPESERFALFEAVAALLEAMTRRQRALLVIDDLHWAANPTLLLLRHVIRSERPLGVLVLGTYRETELAAGHPLAQLLADLHRDASVEDLSIRGLDEPAIAALLQTTTGHAPKERTELARVLRDQTGGNPLFVRELLADLTESGERLSAGVTAEPLRAPERLKHVIGQRVARLSAPTVQALRVAAVAGPTFSFMLLERVLGERASTLDALDEAVTARLLIETGNGEYVFAHALVRQTIYDQLSDARRIHLHRQLGEALETLTAPDGHVEALAHHFAQAAADGQGLKASAYALAAGRRATARLGYEEAAAHYERGLQALTLTGQPQEQRRSELLLALGEAYWGAGELDKARQAYRQAADLADKLGDSTALAHAALGFCGPHLTAAAMAAPIVELLLQRALAALSDNDSALRAQLMGRVAAYTNVGHKSELACEALEMARRIADKETLADALASAHRATRGPDAPPEAMARMRELRRVSADIGHRQLQTLAHGWLLDHFLERGDIEAVERELGALQRLAATRTERYFTWASTVYRTNHAHLTGRVEDCETLADHAFAHRFQGHDEAAAHIFGVQMLFVRREQGRLDELVHTVGGVTERYPQLVAWRCAVAHVYAELDCRTQARQELEALADADFEDLPRNQFWLTNMSWLSEVVAFLADGPRAQRLYELLLPYADRCVVIFALLCRGSASRSLGLLAMTLSRFDDAERHFQHALMMNAQIRSPLWIAHTQHDYARMLLARGKPGDHDTALDLLAQALATAEELGLMALADKTERLKLATQATVSPQGLTSRYPAVAPM